jgi:hypothetical protein
VHRHGNSHIAFSPRRMEIVFRFAGERLVRKIVEGADSKVG